MYATADCQAATPLQVPVAVVVGAAALLVRIVVAVAEEVVVAGVVPVEPEHALTEITCEQIQDKHWMDVLAPHPLELSLVGTELVQ